VRVDFVGGSSAPQALTAPEEDRHWEPVLRSTLLNYEQGRPWRAVSARSLSSRPLFEDRTRPRTSQSLAFDEDTAEVRVKIDSTGVYTLGFDELHAEGYPDHVPISEVSVHRHEYLQDQT